MPVFLIDKYSRARWLAFIEPWTDDNGMERKELRQDWTDRWDPVLRETQEESELKVRDREPEIQGSKNEVRQLGIKYWPRGEGGGVFVSWEISGIWLIFKICMHVLLGAWCLDTLIQLIELDGANTLGKGWGQLIWRRKKPYKFGTLHCLRPSGTQVKIVGHS